MSSASSHQCIAVSAQISKAVTIGLCALSGGISKNDLVKIISVILDSQLLEHLPAIRFCLYDRSLLVDISIDLHSSSLFRFKRPRMNKYVDYHTKNRCTETSPTLHPNPCAFIYRLSIPPRTLTSQGILYRRCCCCCRALKVYSWRLL